MAIGIDNAFTSTRTPLLNAAEPTASKRRLFRAIRSFWRTGTSTEEIVTCSGMLNAELLPQFPGYLLIVTNSPLCILLSEAGRECPTPVQMDGRGGVDCILRVVRSLRFRGI